jgi:hypothetical protein
MPLSNPVPIEKLDFQIVTDSEYQQLETNNGIDEDTIYLVVAD